MFKRGGFISSHFLLSLTFDRYNQQKKKRKQSKEGKEERKYSKQLTIDHIYKTEVSAIPCQS
jgi:hypothetical protein